MPIFWPSTPDELKLYEKTVKFHNLVRNGYIIMTVIAFFSVSLRPLLSSNEYHELPLPYYAFLSKKKTLNYIIMYIYQILSTSILAITNVAFDTLVASFCIHLKGQLDIICWRLEHLSRKINILSKSDSIREELLDLIEYYNCIVKMGKIIENLLKIPVSTQVTCSLFVFIANLLLVFLVSF